MKEVPLTKGYIAFIDDEDFDRVIAQGSWYALVVNRKIYGARDRNTVLLHRFILGLHAGRVPEVDHKDHNGLNCQKYNLRLGSKSQNQANCRKQLRPTSSHFKGVSWKKEKRKWEAYIKVNQRKIALGQFVSEIDAAKAYNLAATKYFGEFAHLNLLTHD